MIQIHSNGNVQISDFQMKNYRCAQKSCFRTLLTLSSVPPKLQAQHSIKWTEYFEYRIEK